MKLPLYQVDAFASELFSGNPAAIVPLDHWLPDATLQAIAEENNLSETAFFVPIEADVFRLRWFTPAAEVDLCGHATLASAFVLYEQLGYRAPAVHFETRSGRLSVSRTATGFAMRFPATVPQRCPAPPALVQALGATPLACLAGRKYMAVYASEDQVRALTPDFSLLKTLDLPGVIATAPGADVDFVSRFFAPKMGVNEDPVTGSAHCELAPYWSERLGKLRLTAHQVSRRGGRLTCEINGPQVILTGQAVLYMTAEITLPASLTQLIAEPALTA
jgi:PhzF family phenazine biosynthesis protein